MEKWPEEEMDLANYQLISVLNNLYKIIIRYK